MPKFVVTITEETTYLMVVEANSDREARDKVWEPLEEVGPEEIGAVVQDSIIESVFARRAYDWEVA